MNIASFGILFVLIIAVVVVSTTRPCHGTGSECIRSCDGKRDGDYQSCRGCDIYASCVAGGLYDSRPCAPLNTVWDDLHKRCLYRSDTCTCQDRLTTPRPPHMVTTEDRVLNVDGQWGRWGVYGQCSVTCGLEGVKIRHRLCNSPTPEGDGVTCDGSSQDIVLCDNTSICHNGCGEVISNIVNMSETCVYTDSNNVSSNLVDIGYCSGESCGLSADSGTGDRCCEAIQEKELTINCDGFKYHQMKILECGCSTCVVDYGVAVMGKLVGINYDSSVTLTYITVPNYTGPFIGVSSTGTFSFMHETTSNITLSVISPHLVDQSVTLQLQRGVKEYYITITVVMK